MGGWQLSSGVINDFLLARDVWCHNCHNFSAATIFWCWRQEWSGVSGKNHIGWQLTNWGPKVLPPIYLLHTQLGRLGYSAKAAGRCVVSNDSVQWASTGNIWTLVKPESQLIWPTTTENANKICLSSHSQLGFCPSGICLCVRKGLHWVAQNNRIFGYFQKIDIWIPAIH